MSLTPLPSSSAAPLSRVYRWPQATRKSKSDLVTLTLAAAFACLSPNVWLLVAITTDGQTERVRVRGRCVHRSVKIPTRSSSTLVIVVVDFNFTIGVTKFFKLLLPFPHTQGLRKFNRIMKRTSTEDLDIWLRWLTGSSYFKLVFTRQFQTIEVLFKSIQGNIRNVGRIYNDTLYF